METFGDDLETMRRVPLADEHVAAICEIGRECSYGEGEMVAELGSPMDRFVYVIEGEIEVVDPFSGERMVPSTLGPTQFMGEIAFLNGGTNMLGMRAVKPTRTIEAPREVMLELMARVPELSDHIITVFAARRRRQFEQNNSGIKLIGADRVQPRRSRTGGHPRQGSPARRPEPACPRAGAQSRSGDRGG